MQSEKIKVFERIPDLYLILSPDLKIINASDEYLNATLTTRENIVGKQFVEVFSDNPQSAEVSSFLTLKLSIEETVKKKQPQQMNVQRYDIPKPHFLGGGFEKKYWRPMNYPVLDLNGNVEYIIHKIIDVTREIEADEEQRKISVQFEQLNKKLTAREIEIKKLYNLFMQSPAAIAVTRGPEHIFEMTNSKYMELVGEHKQIEGKPIREAMPEIVGQGYFRMLDEVYNSQEPFAGYEMAVSIDRTERGVMEESFLNFVCQPVIDSEGHTYGIFMHAVDITNQVNARKQIQLSEEKYRSLFTMMDQGFCLIEMIFDKDNIPLNYRFLEINPVFEKQTGLKNAEGKTARELLPNLEPHWFEIYGKVALTGEPVRFIEESEVMGRWFEVYAFRFGSDSSSKKVALLFTDISERKAAEESLKLKNEQLARINADLDNFIYTASHDLKAPISNLEGLLDALAEESKFNDQQQSLIDMMFQSIKRFKSTIIDLTEISKVQREGVLEQEILNFENVLNEVKLDIRELIERFHPYIETDFIVQQILYSRKNLRSIIYNLLSNSLKYSSPDRPLRIKISTEKTGDFILLKVSDNGLGINKQDQDKLFVMFKRVHQHVEGTGVGLYMIKRMIENAGGKIEIDSKEGKGTTFLIYLKKINY